MKILQVGFPKCGNYLIYRILRAILEQNGAYQSFVTTSGLSEVLHRLCSEVLFMPEHHEITMIDVVGDDVKLVFPCPGVGFISPDMSMVIGSSSLVWSHAKLSKLQNTLARFSNAVCVIREPHQVLNSMMHHVIRPEVRARCPEYTMSTIEEVYSNSRLFGAYVGKYRSYLEDLLECLPREDTTVIDYDALVNDKEGVLEQLGTLGVEFDAERIIEDTSVAAMQSRGNRHVRKARATDYMGYFGSEHHAAIEPVVDIYQQLLQQVGLR